MAGISKKTRLSKNGTKVTKYVITYRDIYGVQHTAGNYDTKKEALKHINDYENVSCTGKNMTLKNVFKPYLDRAEKVYAANTHTKYQAYYDKYFQPIEHLEYLKLNSIMLQNLFDDITKQSPFVAQTCLKMAKAAVNFQIKHKRLRYNIFNEIEKIKTPKADIQHLSISELLYVLEVCKNDEEFKKHYAMLFTFAGSGMREGELFALNIDDFNYQAKTIRVNKQFTRYELKEKPKTDSSNRIIYIFEALADVIEEHKKTLPPNCKLLFPNEAGNYHNASNLRERFWKPLLQKCGITKRVRIHDLRGSYVDLLYANRLSCKFGQNQLGHARAETTNNIYARNNEDMIYAAMDVLNDVFVKKCEPNVSQKEEILGKKIIPFPKTLTERGF